MWPQAKQELEIFKVPQPKEDSSDLRTAIPHLDQSLWHLQLK